MRILISSIIALIHILATNISFAQKIAWSQHMTWEQVKGKAKSEKKMIFVDATATWCVPCKQMDREVFDLPAIADAVNGEFIAVKLQMDSTSIDSEQTKSWRLIAKDIAERYAVRAYPTYLFISPDGELVFRESGAKSADVFLGTLKKAKIENDGYGKQLSDWKLGIRDYSLIPAMILHAESVRDKSMAKTLARDCIEKHVSKLKGKELYNLELLRSIGPYLQADDEGVIKLFYPEANGKRTDSLVNFKGLSKAIMDIVIGKTVNSFLVKEDDFKQPLVKKPRWDKIHSVVSKRYGEESAGREILKAKQQWYLFSQPDWKKLAKIRFEDIRENYLDKEDFQPLPVNLMLWDVFLNVEDKVILKEAAQMQLLAVKQAIKINDDELASITDTYAALLYRIGNNNAEAIKWQEMAVEYRRQKEAKRGDKEPFLGFVKTLEKMKRGEPTWIEAK